MTIRLTHYLLVVALGLSLISTTFYATQGLLTTYNDARAHLNLARLVVDNLNPGLAQLGGVWLPLPHLLMLPFIWSTPLWQTGLAGSIVSMISYILAAVVLYWFGWALTNERGPGVVMAAIWLLNVNALFMQALPMTELLLLLFFILTAYCLLRWLQTEQLAWLLATALSLVGATLTRYDGWFLLVWTTAIVAVVLWSQARGSWGAIWHFIEGRLILFCVLAAAGVLFWLAWNFIIFGDPLYFAYGPYSARAQQARIAANAVLPTAGHLVLSTKAYALATLDTVGWPLAALAIVGLIILPFVVRSWRTWLVLSVLLSPIVFHIVSLYQGHSILVVPELGIHDPTKPASAWFNVRYGLMMLPAVAVFSAYYLRARSWQVLVTLFLVAQTGIFFANGMVITEVDGTRGTSALEVGDVASWLKSNATEESDLILASTAFHSALIHDTGFPLKRFVHEGAGAYWTDSLARPQSQVAWIVMTSGDSGDPVYNALVKQQNPHFTRNFSLAYQGDFINIYRRSPYVVADETDLLYRGQPLHFIGVNSYDLIYRSPEEIKATLHAAKEQGISVIRFWAFGDGFADAIQPAAGSINEDRARRLDFVLATAAQEQLLVIPTLGNNWPDYGGLPQYLRWLGLPATTPAQKEVFFTHPDARHLYRNYLDKIILRQNTITGQPYKHDPSILAWELLNEPRSVSKASQAAVTKWLSEMTEYVKARDSNHLVLSGIEGFTDRYLDEAGPEFVAGNSAPGIDVASAHLYRKHLATPTDTAALTTVIADWAAQLAHVRHPLLIGEVGFSKLEETDRAAVVKAILSTAQRTNIAGVILWNWALTTDDSFGISPNHPEDQPLLETIRTLAPAVK